MTISQKDGVYNAIKAMLEEQSISFEDYQSEPLKLTTEQRKLVTSMLTAATIAGELTVKGKSHTYDDSAALNKYWNGTVGNWLSKDKRFNGNVQHQIKKPGSRAGQGDDMLKNLKALLVQVEAAGTPEQISEVQAEIAKRQAELQAAKAKKVEVNVDLIPESLRHLALVVNND